MEKKKIALVVDRDNWAFANIAGIIKKYISKYEFKIIPIDYLDNMIGRVYLEAEDCDYIHFFWRGNIISSNNYEINDYIYNYGFSPDNFKKKFMNKPVSTAVYDHLYLDDELDITKDIFGLCKNYYVSSKMLFDIYNRLDIKFQPKCVITDGVDLKCFYPINIERFNNIKNRTIKIGWVGNSEWSADKEDFKGVNTILKPAIKELQNEGYNIEAFFADRKERMIPHDKMVEYYSKIDVLVCSSKIEGTPNPVLEAMACGVPIISTYVGIVPQALGLKQKKYILKARNKESMKKLIVQFIDNIDSIKELSDENLKQIKSWDWQKVVKKFEKFFDEVFNEYYKK